MKGSTVWQAYDGSWASQTWDGQVCMIVEWSPSEEEALQYLKDNHSDLNIMPLDDFEKGWQTDIGNPNLKLFVRPEVAARHATSAPGTKPVPKSELLLKEGETEDTLIAPVALSHRLGMPPQYLYQLIYKGKVKTVGERPKLVRIGDIAAHYRKRVVPFGYGPGAETIKPDPEVL